MNTKEVIVVGKIEGKQRPRATTIGGYARVYTPATTRAYECLIAWNYKQQSNILYEANLPLKITINQYYSIPKNVTKKALVNYIDNLVRPTKKPDIDNVVKVVLDALNGVAYKDDTQIVNIITEKFFTTKEERLEIKIENIGG